MGYFRPLLIVLSLVGTLFFRSCEEEDRPIDAELNQYSRSVDGVPTFDGATCLVCIDVHGIGGQENLKWAVNANSNPNYPQWTPASTEAAIKAEILTKIGQCPAGSNVKLQFMYHYDPKKQYQRDGGMTKQSYDWSQYRSVEAVLDSLATIPNNRITKVYLTCCSSHLRPSTVNRAFRLPGVTHVVTVDDWIELECGSIKGAVYPTFQPQPVRVIVWEKEGSNQVAKIPNDPMPEDKKFDINTNTVVNR